MMTTSMIREVSKNAYGLNWRDKSICPFGFEMAYSYATKTDMIANLLCRIFTNIALDQNKLSL